MRRSLIKLHGTYWNKNSCQELQVNDPELSYRSEASTLTLNSQISMMEGYVNDSPPNFWLWLTVIRAHEIEIRRPSVRLWHQLSLNLLHGFLSNVGCCFPWAIRAGVFFFIIFLNWEFVRIFFVFVIIWDPMEEFFFENSTPPSNHFWIFSNSSQKYCFGFLNFFFFSFRFFTII